MIVRHRTTVATLPAVLACLGLGCQATSLPPGGTTGGTASAGSTNGGTGIPIVAGLGTLHDGGSLSVGPGGLIHFQETFVDGGRVLTVTEASQTVMTVTYPDSTHVLASGDTNLDGIPDYQYAAGFDGTTASTTELVDTDFDGIFDQKEEDTFSGTASPWAFTQVLSRLEGPDGGQPGDGGAWVQLSSYSGPANQNNGPDGCNGYDGFPASTSGPSVAVPSTSIAVIDNGTPGACTAAQASAIADAIRISLTEAFSCLANVNIPTLAKLITALDQQTLYVACGNACNQVLASTDLPWASFLSFFQGYQRMNLNLNTNDDEAPLEETLIHELLHFAGIPHAPSNDGNGGHDLVYGCGRYCNACRSSITAGGADTANQFHDDCARCADPIHKLLCGSSTQALPSECTEEAAGDCNGCNSCLYNTISSCDGNVAFSQGQAGGGGCCDTSADCASACGPSETAYQIVEDTCSIYPVGTLCTQGY